MKLHLLISQVQRAGEPKGVCAKDKLGKNWEFYFVYACLTKVIKVCFIKSLGQGRHLYLEVYVMTF